MMEEIYKEVYYGDYCPTCKYADEYIKRRSELLDEIDETFKRIDKKIKELREHLECFGGNK